MGKYYSSVNIKCVLAGWLAVSAVTVCYSQSCNDSPIDVENYKGRFFQDHRINATMFMVEEFISTIFGCHSLCKRTPGCKAVTFNKAVASNPNCKIYSGTRLDRNLEPNRNFDSILLLPITCGKNDIVDGGWSSWEYVGICNVTCGGGIVVQRRSCINPKPSCNGNFCLGDSERTQACMEAPCPVHGGWGNWASTDCTKTCNRVDDSGTCTCRHLTRVCDQPAPLYGGADCNGKGGKAYCCG